MGLFKSVYLSPPGLSLGDLLSKLIINQCPNTKYLGPMRDRRFTATGVVRDPIVIEAAIFNVITR